MNASLVVTAVLSVLLAVAVKVARINLVAVEYPLGWLLVGLVVLLAAYNGRKKLPFLPLAASSSWLQLHIYGGLFSVVVFALHTGFRRPSGTFEELLAFAFLGVAVSGLLGLFLTRTLPARLTTRSEPVLFERIPEHRRVLREEVETLVTDAAEATGSSVISDFYFSTLAEFLSGPRDMLAHLLRSGHPGQRVLAGLTGLERYANAEEVEILSAINERVRLKIDLDYQYALQRSLKYWLFVHIPLTGSLIVLTAVHIVLVYGYRGGAL